ncbi:MAG: nucleoside-diphosphate kinase [Nanoarchaeota archaeon]|nr:nucleoside-diphosphate kinase [Nanoarchaeota archaeon]MCG2717388.1 nucleoside-diphosphate kinase [Nanoarchaeota archaeon]
MIEQTLVLIKPDGVKRGLIGELVKRFENRGLKIVGLKMIWIDATFAKKHYTEDISKRRGEHVRNYLVNFLQESPVVAIVIQGVNAVENVRKIVGGTEPRAAQPGTIRGDFAHVSYSYADKKEMVVRNVVHASGNQEDAKYEIDLWFKPKEIYDYKTAHEEHIF